MAGVTSRPFDPRRRLRCKKHFDRVFREPIRSADPFFTVLARKRSGSYPRLGMAISVRSAGGAVARNRVKRIVRESFRLNQHSLPAVDLVVMGRVPHDETPETARDSRYLLRMDWDGKTLWRRALAAHHDVDVTPDGRILTLTYELRVEEDIDPTTPMRDNSLLLLSAVMPMNAL